MKNRPIYLFLGTALGVYATPALADWCSNNSDDLDYVQSWYNDYYAAFENKEITYNEFKINEFSDFTCLSWDAHDSDENPRYDAHCTEWDADALATDACAQKFTINSTDHNRCWSILTDRDSCDSGGDDEGGSGTEGCPKDYYMSDEGLCNHCPPYEYTDNGANYSTDGYTSSSGNNALKDCYIPNYVTLDIDNKYGYATLKLGSDCYHNGST